MELPGTGHPLGEVGKVVSADLDDGQASIVVELGFPAASAHPAWRDAIAELAVGDKFGAERVNVELTTRIIAHGVQRNLKPLPNVRNIIAVASGKGRRRQVDVAVNLALALAAEGATVGLLDADIYGPSQPHMVGSGWPAARERGRQDDGSPSALHGVCRSCPSVS